MAIGKKKKKGADEAAPATPAPEQAEDGAKKKGGLLPAVVVAIAVLGGGAMAGGLVGGGGAPAEAVAAPAPTPTPIELGTVTELEPVTLNLAGGEGHFLKLGLAIETGPDVAEAPPTAPIYDIVIDQFASHTYEDLLQMGAREQTKEQLLAELSTLFGDDIVRIYYTEFVMQ